ncbi:phage tail tape measure protein [Caldanaerobius polysaccharolyticus]|uniref:phage tail tape measure protein n=1 Tax=Caldanaerobius polysaccharolyticus TaxID=44256 RepID=UPI00047E3B40|nr:phage tail tape measure protein [Caldanaerobius polysaccharolyticus]
MPNEEIGKLNVVVNLDSTGFQNGISQLNRQMKLVQSEFQAATAKLGDFGKGTDGLKLKADALSKQIDIQKQKVAALEAAYQKSVEVKGADAKATQDLVIKLNKAQAELANMENELKKTTTELEKQSSVWYKLSQSAKEAGEKLKNVGEKMTDTGKSLTKYITTPIIGAGAMAVKAAADFESMGNTFQAVSGATSSQMAKMSELAKQLGNDITLPGTSATDAAAAMTELVKAGLSIDDTFKAAKATLQLSAAAQIDNAEAATIVGQALNAFKMSGDKAIMVADLLANSANASAGEITDMAYALQAGASVAAMAGQSINDFTTAIALMANAGITGQDAGTSLKSMLMSLISPTDKAAETMQKYGINVYDANGKMKPLPALVQEFSTKLGGLSQEQKNAALATIFGSDAIRVANIVLMSGTDAWNQMSQAVNKAGGAQEVAASKMKGFNGAMEAFKSTVETLAITIGEKLLPIITPLIQRVTDWINKFGELSPQTQQIILVIVGLAAAIGPVILVVGRLITAVSTISKAFGTLSGAMAAAGGASGAVGTAISALTGPVGIAIAAITGLIAIFVSLYKHNEDFRNKCNEVWNQVKQLISTVTEQIKTILQAFVQLVSAIWNKWGDDIMKIVNATFNVVKTVITTVLSVISGVIKTVTSLIKGDWQGVWNGIKDITNSIWSGIKNIVTSVLNLLTTSISAALNVIKDIFSGIWNGIKTLTSSVWEGMKNTVSNATNSVKNTVLSVGNGIKNGLSGIWESVKSTAINAWSSLKGAASNIFNSIKEAILAPFRNIHIPLPHISVNWKSIGVGDLKIKIPDFDVNWYATGGIFNKPSIIGVGEAGPEAVIPIRELKNILRDTLLDLPFSKPVVITLNDYGQKIFKDKLDMENYQREQAKILQNALEVR